MKLIIDISEGIYKHIDTIQNGSIGAKQVLNAVKDGIPLENYDVLDRIRAELHATAELHDDGDCYLRDEWIDEIFDEYKTESENKE